ncbi:MAG TPA: hypothetical protein VK013_00420 [Myxococcaceae bacterium]|nr:hypothetical protein [Myxococcaceae bacterium]
MRTNTARELNPQAAPLRRQGRRPLPRIRRRAAQAPSQVSLGDLIAAAFEVVGDDPRAVARLLNSAEFRQMTAGRLEVI